MSVVALGDLHLSSARPWSLAVAKQFILWFENWEQNNDDNVLVLLGDLVESHINGGKVIALLEELISKSRFHRVHILVGNHDLKVKDGIPQLAYEFLSSRKRTAIYIGPTLMSIDGLDCLMLPHLLSSPSMPSMTEYYSKIYEEYSGRNIDIVFGHFNDETFPFGSSVKNLEKLNAKHICLGHIHTRIGKRYIGSISANSSKENDRTRSAWIWDSRGNKTEEPLPVFCEYITHQYPDPLPATDVLVPIYTFLGCANEASARSLYGDVYIRKTIKNNFNFKTNTAPQLTLNTEKIEDLFTAFVKSSKNPLDRSVVSLCKGLLTN